MKSKQKGFIIPLIIIIIAALAIGGGVYIHSQNKKTAEQAQLNANTSLDENSTNTNVSSNSSVNNSAVVLSENEILNASYPIRANFDGNLAAVQNIVFPANPSSLSPRGNVYISSKGKIYVQPLFPSAEVGQIEGFWISHYEFTDSSHAEARVDISGGYGASAQDNRIFSVQKISGKVIAKDITNSSSTGTPVSSSTSIEYKNTVYNFSFTLPVSWKGFSIVSGTWQGITQDSVESGPQISIRHPKWTSENPRQDIPIMIFDISQWNSLLQGQFHIGAAPINPSELGRNANYVFALPARYNYAYPIGYEEVETILQGKPLHSS